MLRDYGLDQFSARMEHASITEQLFWVWHFRVPNELVGWLKQMPEDFPEQWEVQQGTLLPDSFQHLLINHLHRLVRPKHQKLFLLALTNYALPVSQRMQIIQLIFLNSMSDFQNSELIKVLENSLVHLEDLTKTELPSILFMLQRNQLTTFWLLNHYGLVPDSYLISFLQYFHQSYSSAFEDAKNWPNYKPEYCLSTLSSAARNQLTPAVSEPLQTLWREIQRHSEQVASSAPDHAPNNQDGSAWLALLSAQLPARDNGDSNLSLSAKLLQLGIQRHVWRQLNSLLSQGVRCTLLRTKPLWLVQALGVTPRKAWPRNEFEWVNWFYKLTTLHALYPNEPQSAAAANLHSSADMSAWAIQRLISRNQQLLQLLFPELTQSQQTSLICQYWALLKKTSKLDLLSLLVVEPTADWIFPLRLGPNEQILMVTELISSRQYQGLSMQWANCLASLRAKAALGLCTVFIIELAGESYLAEVEPNSSGRFTLVQLRDAANEPAGQVFVRQVELWLAKQVPQFKGCVAPQLIASCRSQLLEQFKRRKIVPLSVVEKNFPPTFSVDAVHMQWRKQHDAIF
jgi:hypothetical protein